MSDFPSPVLIFGDLFVSKSQIVGLRKKHSGYQWVTMSASKSSFDAIETESGMTTFSDDEKVLLIEDLPNQKNTREFLLKFSVSAPSTCRVVIWDSTGQIKRDAKSGQILKTWLDFVNKLKAIKGSKVVDNGAPLAINNSDEGTSLVIKLFKKQGKHIDSKTANVFVGIVGNDRGLIYSEVEKMVLSCPDEVDVKFVVNNAFPSTKEAVLYKLSNAFDSGSYEMAIRTIEEFVEMGTDPNVIAEMLLRKARWNMVVASYMEQGLSSSNIQSRMMEMGQFPAYMWHNSDIDTLTKKKQSEILKEVDAMQKYMVERQGMLQRHFKTIDKKKRAERIPMDFMAKAYVDFVKNHGVGQVSNGETLLSHMMSVYLECYKRLVLIRFNEQPMSDLSRMAQVITGVQNGN